MNERAERRAVVEEEAAWAVDAAEKILGDGWAPDAVVQLAAAMVLARSLDWLADSVEILGR